MTTAAGEPFDLTRTFVHLGKGSTAIPLPGFEWSPEYVGTYRSRFAGDAAEGRLVYVIAQSATWDGWERHPGGGELVYLLSGRIDIVQEVEDADHVMELRPGDAMINPANVWHTARVHEPGMALFVTPGEGTEHRPLV